MLSQIEKHPIYKASRAFEKEVPNYSSNRAKRELKLRELNQKLFLEEAKQEMPCSRQILEEVSWYLHYTADFYKVDRMLPYLEKSLSAMRIQSFANEQSPKDGSWGVCCREWFWKVVESEEAISTLSDKGELPMYQTKFLDRINSPEKLLVYLNNLLISDFQRKLIDKRKELNEGVTTLLKLILRDKPKNYYYHPKLKQTFIKFMDEKWQNPRTGFWGAWYKDGNRIIKTDDLSITFHIISYRKDKIKLWKKIVATILEIKDKPYPYGWNDIDGKMIIISNHNNYDVVRLLHYGWEYLDEKQKEEARSEIKKMLDWCLGKSIQGDGSFKYSEETLGDSYYFGVAFLNEIGFFSKENRFWTNEEFPQAEAYREKILSKLKTIKSKNQGIKDAETILHGINQ
ncbi:MAG: hypothetical protein NTY22_01185 [Proteobacteria bacterium]|nr:hypothetical protein [Pseudomonadota bacterium]